MSATKQRLTALLSGLLLLAATRVSAAQGNVMSIELRDLNHNGKIERALLTVDNRDGRRWQVNSAAGFKVWYGATALKLTHVFVVGDPATSPIKIEAVWDETDPNLPMTTASDQFEVENVSQPLGSGIDDGNAALAPIARGDLDASTTELDRAAPILVSTLPLPGSLGVARDQTITLNFSEPIDKTSFSYVSAPDLGGWNDPVWNANATQVSIDHVKYTPGAAVTFKVDAKDLAGNALVPGDLTLDPFQFHVTSSSANLSYDNVFAINEPRGGDALVGGAPTPISWYTNRADVAEVRLSFVTSYGSLPLADVPASAKQYLWHPNNDSAYGQIRAELRSASGAVVDALTTDPITITRTPIRGAVAEPPAVSDITGTTAVLSVGLLAPVKETTLECNDLLRPEVVSASGDRPTTLTVILTGLVPGQNERCDLKMKDLAGESLIANFPQFIPGTAADTTPPKLTGAPAFDQYDPTAKTIRMSWETDEPSTASLSYGVYKNYGGQAADANLSTTHSVTLTGLTPGALHQVRITSIDAKGNAAVSVDYGFVFLKDGDRIKGAASSAVYLYQGGKRLVFPNEAIYKSWFHDFNGVITVPNGQLSSTLIGGNVKMKEGVYLIKIQSDPKTYAVEPGGILRWVQTEAQAKRLYGDAWNKRVRDVDVSLFVDYHIGDPLGDQETPAGYVK